LGGKEDELSEKARHFGSETWEREVLQAQGPVLVDFWATWCPPCRVLGPVIDELAGTYAGRITVGKVNVDENEDLALRYGIQSIPTLLLFDKGEPVVRQIGAAPRHELVRALDAHLEGATVPAAG